MPGVSDRLGLALPIGTDDFDTAELSTNLETLDGYPGVLPVTTLGAAPVWGPAQAGQYVTDLATGLIWRWNGSAFVRDLGKGWLSGGTRTTDAATSSSTYAAVLTLAGVVVPAGGRKIQVMASWLEAYGKGYIALFRGATQLREYRVNLASAADTCGGSITIYDTPAAGTYTYTVQTKADSGESVTVVASATNQLMLDVVEV